MVRTNLWPQLRPVRTNVKPVANPSPLRSDPTMVWFTPQLILTPFIGPARTGPPTYANPWPGPDRAGPLQRNFFK
jgi:hypothetical protein